jgi:hypothetical protein
MGFVRAGGGPLSATGTLFRERQILSARDFEVFGHCSPGGVTFYVINRTGSTSNILQKLPAQEPTVVTMADGGSSPFTPERTATTVIFLSGERQNPFVFTVWGMISGTTCTVNAISTSELQ